VDALRRRASLDVADVAFQDEEHHGVGLLGQLVAVGIVTLRPQDPIEPLDVPVLGPVGLPVELLEVVVALELADDSVAVAERPRGDRRTAPSEVPGLARAPL
jgi:hypothetical protein